MFNELSVQVFNWRYEYEHCRNYHVHFLNTYVRKKMEKGNKTFFVGIP
jgi:hypothetical protein